jgi:hypothetical protein
MKSRRLMGSFRSTKRLIRNALAVPAADLHREEAARHSEGTPTAATRIAEW